MFSMYFAARCTAHIFLASAALGLNWHARACIRCGMRSRFSPMIWTSNTRALYLALACADAQRCVGGRHVAIRGNAVVDIVQNKKIGGGDALFETPRCEFLFDCAPPSTSVRRRSFNSLPSSPLGRQLRHGKNDKCLSFIFFRCGFCECDFCGFEFATIATIEALISLKPRKTPLRLVLSPLRHVLSFRLSLWRCARPGERAKQHHRSKRAFADEVHWHGPRRDPETVRRSICLTFILRACLFFWDRSSHA
jgi:hypothetical protein